MNGSSWLPSQTDLESGRLPCMILRRLGVLVFDVVKECSYSSSLESLYSSSLGELSSGFSESYSLVDLPLIVLEDCSVRRLGNSFGA
jgi:hypothetical protein